MTPFDSYNQAIAWLSRTISGDTSIFIRDRTFPHWAQGFQLRQDLNRLIPLDVIVRV